MYNIYLLGKPDHKYWWLILYYTFAPVHLMLLFKFLALMKYVHLHVINVIFRTCGTCNLHSKLNVSDSWEILHQKPPRWQLETDKSILSGLHQQYLRVHQHTSKWMWYSDWGEQFYNQHLQSKSDPVNSSDKLFHHFCFFIGEQ